MHKREINHLSLSFKIKNGVSVSINLFNCPCEQLDKLLESKKITASEYSELIDKFTRVKNNVKSFKQFSIGPLTNAKKSLSSDCGCKKKSIRRKQGKS